ncbi:CAP domain-containing protein [Pseudogemmobacter faecipullorum]|uniref:CAP domain-containing protein n=1 Tax=Pseudogemmobacter faecipullorum TaxID=2755041 RepID=A0ABS8CHN2_9RHOB|nr:CAP domain-containing protein [Pseudogemmobacter faecipullorum]MCB5408891.1 CAP domain-containing protein [Pseudogemmobacter faecipullorum]
MNRRGFLLLGSGLLLAGCVSGGSAVQLGPDGKPLPRVYRITPAVAGQIQYRLLDSVNTLRQAKGAQPLVFNASLNAAAETHSRDMSVQNRPWHFGSDGSSPLSRVQRAGYTGRLLGENISETYQTELETLSVWMESPDQRNVVLDPAARELGFAWYQEEGGKIWWTMVTGG